LDRRTDASAKAHRVEREDAARITGEHAIRLAAQRAYRQGADRRFGSNSGACSIAKLQPKMTTQMIQSLR
jgi:hypothetical protein